MKKIKNLPFCILLGFLSYFFLMSVYGHEILIAYEKFSEWKQRPSAEKTLAKNIKLTETITKLQMDKINLQYQLKLQENNDLLSVNSNERSARLLSKLEKQYTQNEEKLKARNLQDSERRRLLVSLSEKDLSVKRIYFLMGYGCLHGQEIFSLRETQYTPSWGYCFYRDNESSELVYYDKFNTAVIETEYSLVQVIKTQELLTSNEVVFNSYDEGGYQYVTLILHQGGGYSEKYKLDLSEVVNTTKASKIPMIDPLNNNGTYLMKVNHWTKSFFLNKKYKEFWSKGICFVDTDRICVKQRLVFEADDSMYKISKTAEITYMYDYSNLQDVIDKKIEFRTDFGGDKTQNIPQTFDELVKLETAASGWVTPK